MDTLQLKLAVLIDADNSQYTAIANLLSEVAKYGIASVKRAYGDWTTDNLNGWKAVLHKYAIQPIQQFNYTTGKNSTDSSLIIDAMDLLYTGKFGGFCIVSSDSDFTRLATRIRESGLKAIGFGEKKTPKPFIAACDSFVYLENLTGLSSASTSLSGDTELREIILKAIENVSRDDGWAALSAIGCFITQNNPDFDSRSYGSPKLGHLVKNLDYIQVEERKSSESSQIVHIYIKQKEGN